MFSFFEGCGCKTSHFKLHGFKIYLFWEKNIYFEKKLFVSVTLQHKYIWRTWGCDYDNLQHFLWKFNEIPLCFYYESSNVICANGTFSRRGYAIVHARPGNDAWPGHGKKATFQCGIIWRQPEQWFSRSFPVLWSLLWVVTGVLLTYCNWDMFLGKSNHNPLASSDNKYWEIKKIYFNTYLGIADIEYERHGFCSWKEVEGHSEDTYFCTSAWRRSHLVLVKRCFSTILNSWECCPAFLPIENIWAFNAAGSQREIGSLKPPCLKLKCFVWVSPNYVLFWWLLTSVSFCALIKNLKWKRLDL